MKGMTPPNLLLHENGKDFVFSFFGYVSVIYFLLISNGKLLVKHFELYSRTNGMSGNQYISMAMPIMV